MIFSFALLRFVTALFNYNMKLKDVANKYKLHFC